MNNSGDSFYRVDRNGKPQEYTEPISYPKRPRLKDPFMIVMLDAARRLAEDKEIKLDDHRVLFYLISIANYENYIPVSQVTIAEDLGMRKQQVNRAIKKLLNKKILLEVGKEGRNKVYRFNSFYGWRGKISKEYQEAFEEDSKLVP